MSSVYDFASQGNVPDVSSPSLVSPASEFLEGQTPDGEPAKLSAPDEGALMAKVKTTFAALNAHADDFIEKRLAFGEAIYEAREIITHGGFEKWCRLHLQRASTWVSNHRRLYVDRDVLKPALEWARTHNPKLASSRSVEALLKVVAAFKKGDVEAISRDRASKPTQKITAPISLTQAPKQAECDVTLLRELVPPEVIARAYELSLAASTGDSGAAEALDRLKQECHSRLTGLVMSQTSGAQELSHAHIAGNSAPGRALTAEPAKGPLCPPRITGDGFRLNPQLNRKAPAPLDVPAGEHTGSLQQPFVKTSHNQIHR